MGFKKFVMDLEKKKVITIEPHPAIPFIIFFLALGFGINVLYSEADNLFGYVFFFLAGFTLIFAILHWIIVRIVRKRNKI
jgi:hypothetical protein